MSEWSSDTGSAPDGQDASPSAGAEVVPEDWAEGSTIDVETRVVSEADDWTGTMPETAISEDTTPQTGDADWSESAEAIQSADVASTTEPHENWDTHPETADASSEGDLAGPNQFSDSAMETPVGTAFLPEDDQSAAFDVPAYDGEYVLDVHGTPDSVDLGDLSLGPTEFASVVKNSTSWNGQDPIRLFSCNTGERDDGFAQHLADELGVPVTAPTAPVWSFGDGSEPIVSDSVFDPDTGQYNPSDPPTGTWKYFNPR